MVNLDSSSVVRYLICLFVFRSKQVFYMYIAVCYTCTVDNLSRGATGPCSIVEGLLRTGSKMSGLIRIQTV